MNAELIREIKSICETGGTPTESGWECVRDLLLRAAAALESGEKGNPDGSPDGVGLIAAERMRQVQVEGWDADHDDDHDGDDLPLAAVSYALPVSMRGRKTITVPPSPRSPEQNVTVPRHWPWDAEWWKPDPGDRVRELAKAGALIAAEIDRLHRALAPKETQHG